MVSGSKVSLLLGSGSAERVLGLLCSVGPWCKLAGQTGGFEGTETATKSACPFRAWSMSSLIMHGLGCVADVSYSGVCVLESIFLVCSKRIPSLCTLEVAWMVFPSAAEMRHQDKEVSVVPDFPFYLPYFFFLIRPQRDLAESLIYWRLHQAETGQWLLWGWTRWLLLYQRCLFGNKLLALHPDICLVQELELFLLADYRS